MGVQRLYFDSAGAGAADGSSWANRAPLLSAGVVSSLIRGFDYTSDSLEAFIGPGTYAITSTLSAFTGAAAPSVNNPCMLMACDSSGDKWIPPDPDWCCAQPCWDTTSMPLINNGTNQLISQTGIGIYGLNIVGSHNGVLVSTHYKRQWCRIENTASHTSAQGTGTVSLVGENNVIVCSGTAYSTVASAAIQNPLRNERIEGNINATSGTRYGLLTGGNGEWRGEKIVVLNNVGYCIGITGTGNQAAFGYRNVVVWNSAATAGAAASNNTTRLSPGYFANSVIIGATTYGIEHTNTNRTILSNNAFRDCASGNVSNPGNQHDDSVTITETDAQLFVDSANGDFRIKNTSAHWGKNIGAGDEPAAGGGSSGFPLSRLVM